MTQALTVRFVPQETEEEGLPRYIARLTGDPAEAVLGKLPHMRYDRMHLIGPCAVSMAGDIAEAYSGSDYQMPIIIQFGRNISPSEQRDVQWITAHKSRPSLYFNKLNTGFVLRE